MQLIWNWKDAWRWMSVRLIAASAGLQVSLLAFPQQLSQYIPQWILQTLAVACLVGAVLGRVTTSEPPHVDPH